jgi:membrane-associated phospholipid phosphatase
VDTRFYLDVNRFAMRTAWAHGVLAFFARPSALVILAVLLALALARARVTGFGGSDIDQIAALVWAAIGTALAYAISLPIVHLVGRTRPFVAMPQAAVLVARPTGFSFPNDHAVIAGAFAAALWLSRARLMAAIATLVAIIVAFALVYSGTAYPGDAAGGLLLGTLVSLALYPFAIGSLRDLAHAVARSPLKVLVGGGHHGGAVGPGPASRPTLVGESGTVRILSPEEVQAGRTKPSAHAGPVRILPPGQTGTSSILPPDETGGIRILPPRDAGSGSGAGTARS